MVGSADVFKDTTVVATIGGARSRTMHTPTRGTVYVYPPNAERARRPFDLFPCASIFAAVRDYIS